MKNLLWAGFLFLFGIQTFAQSTELRKAYREATKSEENANAFYQFVKNVSESDNPTLMAYKGAGKTLLARYAPLFDRKEKIKDGINWVENAVKKSPENVEIRLIRLSIQENLPKLFKYNDDIQSDKKFIKEAMLHIKDKELLEMINGYFEDFSKK
jgi:hypothetical protein